MTTKGVGSTPSPTPTPAAAPKPAAKPADVAKPFDADGDGVVTKQEFVKGMADEMAIEETDVDGQAMNMAAAFGAGFEKAGGWGNPLGGLISGVGEMIADAVTGVDTATQWDFVKEGGLLGSIDAKNPDVASFDTDGDGKVNFQEFQAGRNREAAAAKMFDKLDKDHDGSIIVDAKAHKAHMAEAKGSAGDAIQNAAKHAAEAAIEAAAKAKPKADAKVQAFDFSKAGEALKAITQVITADTRKPAEQEKQGADGFVGKGDKANDQYLLRKFPDAAEMAVKEFVAKHNSLPKLDDLIRLTKAFSVAGVDPASIENVKNSI